jgi:hypothetical protein
MVGSGVLVIMFHDIMKNQCEPVSLLTILWNISFGLEQITMTPLIHSLHIGISCIFHIFS